MYKWNEAQQGHQEQKREIRNVNILLLEGELYYHWSGTMLFESELGLVVNAYIYFKLLGSSIKYKNISNMLKNENGII